MVKVLRAIILVLLFAIVGFLIGAWITSLTIEKPGGLAGPGVVVGSGFFSAIGGVLISLIILAKASVRKIVIIIIIGVLGAILMIGLLGQVGRAQTKSKRSEITPIAQLSNFQRADVSMGLGMVYPNIYYGETLYFYSPNLEKSAADHTPVDSITFQKTEIGVDISYAPPWFYPEHLKMDYDLLILKVISVTKDWVQLEVNKQTKRTAWIDASQVTITSWPEFMLKVNTVAPINGEMNPLKQRPFIHASSVNLVGGEFYKPFEITNEWIRVEVLDSNYKKLGAGWLKWRSGNQLLVTYSLLS